MNRRSLVALILLSAASTFGAPQPSPSPSPHRPKIADLDRGGGGGTVAERHPWIGRVEDLIEVCLMFVGIHRR